MAPTGPITSWQILLEISAASSRSVGWARSVIGGPRGQSGSWTQTAAEKSARHASPRYRFAPTSPLDTCFAPYCKGGHPGVVREGCFFVVVRPFVAVTMLIAKLVL